MKPCCSLHILFLAGGLAAGLCGCKPRQVQTDATKPLEQSFKQAEPEVKQTIAAVNNNLKVGNYQDAGRLLEPVVTRRQLNPEQKQAVALALQQLNQAVARNPALDSKEMYELRNKMFQALHNGPRF